MRAHRPIAASLLLNVLGLAACALTACADPDGPMLAAVPEQDGAVPPKPSATADAGDDGTSVPACALPPSHTAACNACMNARCRTECDVCAGSASCTALWTCVLTTCILPDGTTDQGCGLDCAVANVDGIDTFSAFAKGMDGPGCLSNLCTTECAKL